MRGIPKIIQTRADLQNLFALAMQEESDVDRAELAKRVRDLLACQYHRVPVLAVDGKTVTTPYFAEAKKNGTTEDGLTIAKVVHNVDNEAEGEGAQYSSTEITLSAVPGDSGILSVYMEDNRLAQRGFDLNEINNYLGVLEQ